MRWSAYCYSGPAMKFPTRLVAFLSTTLLAATAAYAQTSYTSVDISGQTNANIQTYTGGGNYQLGGTTLTVAGVPFQLVGGPGQTDVVQTGGASTSFTFSIPAGTYATTLYTLINTAWGQLGQDEGSVVVTGSLGETATLNLTEGVN